LTRKTGRTLGQFIFEELLCRWGGLEEIVIDNRTPFVAALDWIATRYHVQHIWISAYNSQSNGVVEMTYRMVWDTLIKVCKGNMKRWQEYAPYVFWADRVTMQKSTRMSPFYAAHGIEPLLPFDITEAMFLVPKITAYLPTASLLTIHAQMLQKHEEDLARIHNHVLAARYTSTWDFEKQNTNWIQDYNFESGELVLVLNKKIKPEVGQKCRPRYFGPMVVVNWLQGGAYTLAEINGAVSHLKYVAFYLISYYACSQNHLEITEFIDANDLSKGEEAGVEDVTRMSS